MQSVPFIIIASSLMPYLPAGFRVEHLFVPFLAMVAFFQARSVHGETTLSVGALGVALVAVALSATLSWQTGLMAEPLSQWIRLVMPMLMLLAFPSCLARVPNTVVTTCYAIVAAAVAVVIFTVASIYSGQVKEWLLLWVKAEEGSIWMLAQDVGRITGLFNQPLEAGIFYSVALFATVYLLKIKQSSRPLLVPAIGAIIAGGALCLSKNFLVLGVALAFALAVWLKIISVRMAVILTALVVVCISFLLTQYFVNFADEFTTLYYNGGFISAITAGRYGLDESEVTRLFRDVWGSNDWILGRGPGSHLPLDNGFLEFFYQGGIIAVGGYIVFLSSLAVYGYMNRGFEEGKLLFILIAYIGGSSLGGPAVTANRANVALMLLVAACLVSIRIRKRGAFTSARHRRKEPFHSTAAAA